MADPVATSHTMMILRIMVADRLDASAARRPQFCVVSGLRHRSACARACQLRCVQKTFFNGQPTYLPVWMRPGEVIILRTCHLDTNDGVRLYRPTSRKTEHFGHERNVERGPRAQAIIELFQRRAGQSPGVSVGVFQLRFVSASDSLRYSIARSARPVPGSATSQLW